MCNYDKGGRGLLTDNYRLGMIWHGSKDLLPCPKTWRAIVNDRPTTIIEIMGIETVFGLNHIKAKFLEKFKERIEITLNPVIDDWYNGGQFNPLGIVSRSEPRNGRYEKATVNPEDEKIVVLTQSALKENFDIDITKGFMQSIPTSELTLRVLQIASKLPHDIRIIDTVVKQATDKIIDVDLSQVNLHQIVEDALNVLERKKNGLVNLLVDLLLEKFNMRVITDTEEIIIWDGNRWQGKESGKNQELRLRTTISNYEPDLKTHEITEVIEKLKLKSQLHIDRTDLDQKNGLACQDGWIDLETGDLLENNPDRLNRRFTSTGYEQCHIDIDKEIELSVIDNVLKDTLYLESLKQCFKIDGKIRFKDLYTFLEMLAYSLGSECSLQKGFMMIGKGSNGKSVFLEHAVSMIGNAAHESIHNIASDRFRIANLEGKLINVYADIESQELRQGTGVIKMLITGDQISVERKYSTAYNITPYATLIFSANTIPPVNDQSDAFFRRFIIIPWDKQFTTKEQITDLKDRLIADHKVNAKLLGLLVKIRQKLYARGRFRYTKTTQETRQIWQENSDVIGAFDREYLTASDTMSISQRELYDGYFLPYCFERGVNPPRYGTFNKSLNNLYERFDTSKDGKSVRAWPVKVKQNIQTKLKNQS